MSSLAWHSLTDRGSEYRNGVKMAGNVNFVLLITIIMSMFNFRNKLSTQTSVWL